MGKGTKQSCTCPECQDMCKRPCWGFVKEIDKLIAAGFGDYLMLDYWVGDSTASDTVSGGDIMILSPACWGYTETYAPFWPIQGCVFQVDGLCTIHDLGFKPAEGRAAIHGVTRVKHPTVRDKIVKGWNSDRGRKLVADWKAKHLQE